MGGSGEGPVDGPLAGRPLLEGETFELLAEAVDLPLELTGVQSVPGPGEGPTLGRGEDPGIDGSLEGGGGGVMALDDLGPDPGPGDQLLLGQHQVGEAPVELPDPVEQAELGRRVEAEIADQLSDVGPVLLFDMRPVVLVARPGPGEGDLSAAAVLEEVGVDELGAVVRVEAEDPEREAPSGAVDGPGHPDGRLVLDRAV